MSDIKDGIKHALFSHVIVQQWCHAVSTKSVAQWLNNLRIRLDIPSLIRIFVICSLTDNSAHNHSTAWLSSDINMIISLCLSYLDRDELERRSAACRVVLLIAEKSPLLLGSHVSSYGYFVEIE